VDNYTGFHRKSRLSLSKLLLIALIIFLMVKVDFARVSEPDDPIENQENTFPHIELWEYKIPREFVLNINKRLDGKSMNPLLVGI
jgi:hypothetical protein